jgi:hypothetical protein
MLNLKMDVYTKATGVQMTIAWANEEEYQLAKKFLTDMGASCSQPSDRRGDKPAFFYLENKQQLESLYEFRRSLREKAKI